MFADLDLNAVILAAFLAFCRIGACFMLMPGLSSARVPMHVRLFVALAVTWALLVHLWDSLLPYVDSAPDRLLMLVVSELLIGAVIGLVTRFYTLALQFTGAAVAMMGGFAGMGGAAIEENEPQAALAVIITLSALMVLFTFDFHHDIVRALVESYRVAPPSLLFDPQSALIDLADTISRSFYVTLRLASPFIAYAILVNLAAGFINKLAPQIPVYFVSMPFVIAGTLTLAYFGIGMMLSLFADGFLPTTIGR